MIFQLQFNPHLRATATVFLLALLSLPRPSVATFDGPPGVTNPLDGVNPGLNSTIALVDIDGDGDFDAFLGESGGTVKFYRNTGSASSPTMTSVTGASNPFNGVDVGSDSAPIFVDIDNDGDKDAFIGADDGTIYFYRNDGSSSSPTMTSVTGASNPFNGVDVGTESKLAFVDIDNDGDQDCFIGNQTGAVDYYKNTGSVSSAVFTQQTGSANPFNGVDIGSRSAPSFVDFDGDGDLDGVFGESQGDVHFFVNTGSNTSPEYGSGGQFTSSGNNPFNGVDLTANCTPAFADMDNDGDQDFFSGSSTGTMYYFANNGFQSMIVLSEQTGSSNPFNGEDVGSNSAPAFADIDGDGDRDAFVGESTGTIKFYRNTGSSTSPAFTEITGASNPFNGEDIGSGSTVALVDIDNDGDFDAFIGESDGTINFYRNTGSSSSPTMTAVTGASNPFNGVDVGTNSAPTFVDIDNDGDKDAFIGAGDGTIYFYRNTGSASSATMTAVTGSSNPFNGVDVGSNSALTFADIDSAGDQDCFIGNSTGATFYYLNTGSVTVAVFSLQAGSWMGTADVGSDAVPVAFDIDGDGDIDLVVGESSGTLNVFLYIDATAPFFKNSYPLTANVAATSVDISVQIEEPGKVYYVFVANGATAVEPTRILFGQDATFASALFSGSITVTAANTTFTATVTGLSSNTSYDIYLVPQDDESSPNTLGYSIKLDVTTSASPPTESTAAAGLSGASVVSPGSEVQILSIGITGANSATLTSIALTISDLSAATGLAAADFTQLRLYRSSDASLGGDTQIGTQSTVNIGSATTISPTATETPANGSETFYIVSAVISSSASGTSFRVGFAAGGATTSAATLGTAVAASDANKVTLGSPTLSLPSSVTVAAVVWGTSGTATLTVGNTGSSTLTISGISSSDSRFAVSPSSFAVAAGGSQAVTVTFTPTGVGSVGATLTVSSADASVGSQTVSLSATGTDGAVTDFTITHAGQVKAGDGFRMTIGFLNTYGKAVSFSGTVKLADIDGHLTSSGEQTLSAASTATYDLATPIERTNDGAARTVTYTLTVGSLPAKQGSFDIVSRFDHPSLQAPLVEVRRDGVWVAFADQTFIGGETARLRATSRSPVSARARLDIYYLRPTGQAVLYLLDERLEPGQSLEFDLRLPHFMDVPGGAAPVLVWAAAVEGPQVTLADGELVEHLDAAVTAQAAFRVPSQRVEAFSDLAAGAIDGPVRFGRRFGLAVVFGDETVRRTDYAFDARAVNGAAGGHSFRVDLDLDLEGSVGVELVPGLTEQLERPYLIAVGEAMDLDLALSLGPLSLSHRMAIAASPRRAPTVRIVRVETRRTNPLNPIQQIWEPASIGLAKDQPLRVVIAAADDDPLLGGLREVGVRVGGEVIARREVVDGAQTAEIPLVIPNRGRGDWPDFVLFEAYARNLRGLESEPGARVTLDLGRRAVGLIAEPFRTGDRVVNRRGGPSARPEVAIGVDVRETPAGGRVVSVDIAKIRVAYSDGTLGDLDNFSLSGSGLIRVAQLPDGTTIAHPRGTTDGQSGARSRWPGTAVHQGPGAAAVVTYPAPSGEDFQVVIRPLVNVVDPCRSSGTILGVAAGDCPSADGDGVLEGFLNPGPAPEEVEASLDLSGDDVLGIEDLCVYRDALAAGNPHLEDFTEDGERNEADLAFFATVVAQYTEKEISLDDLPPPVPGDFNWDAQVDAADERLLRDAIVAGRDEIQFDLNGSGAVDENDYRFFFELYGVALFGDLGIADPADLLTNPSIDIAEDDPCQFAGTYSGFDTSDCQSMVGDLLARDACRLSAAQGAFDEGDCRVRIGDLLARGACQFSETAGGFDTGSCRSFIGDVLSIDPCRLSAATGEFAASSCGSLVGEVLSLEPGSTLLDMESDRGRDVHIAQVLRGAINANIHDLRFDVNGSGAVDEGDYRYLVAVHRPRLISGLLARDMSGDVVGLELVPLGPEDRVFTLPSRAASAVEAFIGVEVRETLGGGQIVGAAAVRLRTRHRDQSLGDPEHISINGSRLYHVEQLADGAWVLSVRGLRDEALDDFTRFPAVLTPRTELTLGEEAELAPILETGLFSRVYNRIPGPNLLEERRRANLQSPLVDQAKLTYVSPAGQVFEINLNLEVSALIKVKTLVSAEAIARESDRTPEDEQFTSALSEFDFDEDDDVDGEDLRILKDWVRRGVSSDKGFSNLLKRLEAVGLVDRRDPDGDGNSVSATKSGYSFSMRAYNIADYLKLAEEIESSGVVLPAELVYRKGDFNEDETVDEKDAALLKKAIQGHSVDGFFDLDNSGTIDKKDHAIFTQHVLPRHITLSAELACREGDFNGDGAVDGKDIALLKKAIEDQRRFRVDEEGVIRFAGGGGVRAVGAGSTNGFFDVNGDGYVAADDLRALNDLIINQPAGKRMVVARQDGAETTALGASYPNPFNLTTVIPIQVAKPGLVRLSIYDVLGREVRTLVDEVRAAGRYRLAWEGTDAQGRPVAAGIYLSRLQTADGVRTGKLLLVK